MSKEITAGAPVGAPASVRSIRRRLACFLAFALAICVLAIAPPQFAVTQQPTTTAAARNTALIAATDKMQ